MIPTRVYPIINESLFDESDIVTLRDLPFSRKYLADRAFDTNVNIHFCLVT